MFLRFAFYVAPRLRREIYQRTLRYRMCEIVEHVDVSATKARDSKGSYGNRVRE